MRKSFKYRLYPNKQTEAILLSQLETCRRLYNNSLSERKNAYKLNEESISCFQQQKDLVIEKQNNEFLRSVHSQVLQDTLWKHSTEITKLDINL